jgi:hypothetical protein
LIELHGLLETSLLRTKVLHSQKLGSQAHVEQDDDGQEVLVRKGVSSRQVSGIDQEGSVEDRKCVLVLQEERESSPQGNASDWEESAIHFVGEVHVLLLVVADVLKKPVDSYTEDGKSLLEKASSHQVDCVGVQGNDIHCSFCRENIQNVVVVVLFGLRFMIRYERGFVFEFLVIHIMMMMGGLNPLGEFFENCFGKSRNLGNHERNLGKSRADQERPISRCPLRKGTWGNHEQIKKRPYLGVLSGKELGEITSRSRNALFM